MDRDSNTSNNLSNENNIPPNKPLTKKKWRTQSIHLDTDGNELNPPINEAEYRLIHKSKYYEPNKKTITRYIKYLYKKTGQYRIEW